MADEKPAEPKVPIEEWTVEPPFDSAEYLNRAATGPPEEPEEPPADE